MDEADLYADEIGIISQGRIITTGSVSELKHSVGGEMLLLELAEDGGGIGEPLVQSIRALPDVRGVGIDGSKLAIAAENAEKAIPSVMRILDSAGILVERVSVNEPTLDDVFFKYAGTRLEAGARISEIKQVRGMIRRG